MAANKQLYVTLPKRQKMLLSRSIVHAVRSQNPPGRFLQKDSKTDRWYDVGDQKAQEKTSQALREGAPDLRTKLKDDNKGIKSDSSSGKANSSGKRSDDEGGGSSSRESSRSPVPKSSSAVKETNPLSRATSGSVSSQVTEPTSSANSVGQVLPPAARSGTTQDSNQNQTRNDMTPPSSMPPPATRSSGMNGSSTQQQQQQQQQQRMQQQMHQQMQQQQQQQYQIPMMAGMQQQGSMQGMQIGMPNGMQIPMQPGLSAGHVQQGPNGTMYYTAPNMPPMQMYPTMMYNQQGVLVPVMSVLPPTTPMHVPPQGPVTTTTPLTTPSSAAEGNDSGQGDLGSSNVNARRSLPQHHQQQHHYDSNKNNSQQRQKSFQDQQYSHFDQKLEGMALPPDGLDTGGLSFGSLGSTMMSESEVKRLEAAGAALGNIAGQMNSHQQQNNNNNNSFQAMQRQQQYAQQQQQLLQQQQFLQQQQQLIQHYQQQQQNMHQQQYQSNQQQQFHGHHRDDDDDAAKAAPPPDGGLEPQGLSFGSVSLMSMGDAKLEHTGISFGSAMSFKNTPDIVDGGLDGIGMSFGSMTLDTNQGDDPQNNPHNIAPPPPNDLTRKQSAPLPTLFQQNRSNDNLLECSDTDSDTEEQSAQKSQHKSIEWEKMKAMVNAGSGADSANPDALPISQSTLPTSFSIPSTTFQRDFSQMSALSVGDGGDADEPNLNSLMAAAAMPPPPPKKQDDDGEWQDAELLILKSQQSSSNANNYTGQQQR